jgi:hypothetical protein
MIKSITLDEKWSSLVLSKVHTKHLLGGTGGGSTPPPVSEKPPGENEEEGNNTISLLISIQINI